MHLFFKSARDRIWHRHQIIVSMSSNAHIITRVCIDRRYVTDSSDVITLSVHVIIAVRSSDVVTSSSGNRYTCQNIRCTRYSYRTIHANVVIVKWQLYFLIRGFH